MKSVGDQVFDLKGKETKLNFLTYVRWVKSSVIDALSQRITKKVFVEKFKRGQESIENDAKSRVYERSEKLRESETSECCPGYRFELY